MDWAGVDKAVLLQGPYYGDQNSVVADAVTQYPDRFIGAAYFDPWGDNPAQSFGEILRANSFRAIKLECSVPTGLCGIHPDARLDDPRFAAIWDQLEAAGFVLVLDLGTVRSRSYQTEAVRTIAQRHPRLRIVIPHLAQITPSVAGSHEKRRSLGGADRLGPFAERLVRLRLAAGLSSRRGLSIPEHGQVSRACDRADWPAKGVLGLRPAGLGWSDELPAGSPLGNAARWIPFFRSTRGFPR